MRASVEHVERSADAQQLHAISSAAHALDTMSGVANATPNASKGSTHAFAADGGLGGSAVGRRSVEDSLSCGDEGSTMGSPISFSKV